MFVHTFKPLIQNDYSVSVKLSKEEIKTKAVAKK